MARPLRIEYPGAIYHVTSRSDRRETIYESDYDRLEWLDILSRACDRFNWRVHAYCMMDNHYHLILETVDGNLSKGMRHLNGVYTQYFNRRHKRVGPIFQGRFKAILVEKEVYLLELSRYVVLNPIRAQLVKHIDQWKWSSYLAMTGKASAPGWLEMDWLLNHFARQHKRAREEYINFVRAGIGLPSIWENLQQQIYLATESFISRIQEKIYRKEELGDIPALQKRALPKSISYYRNKFDDENVAIKETYLSGGYTMKEIGEHYGKHHTTVSKIIKRYE